MPNILKKIYFLDFFSLGRFAQKVPSVLSNFSKFSKTLKNLSLFYLQVSLSNHRRGAPKGVGLANPPTGAPNPDPDDPKPPLEAAPNGDGLVEFAKEPKLDEPKAAPVPEPNVWPPLEPAVGGPPPNGVAGF